MSDFDLNSVGLLAAHQEIVPTSIFSSWFSIAVLVGVALFIGLSILIAQNWKNWSIKKFVVSTGNLIWVTPILLAIGWVGWIVAPHLTTLERDAAYTASDVEFVRNLEEAGKEFRPGIDSSQLEQWVLSGQVDRGEYVDVPVHGGWRGSLEEARTYANREATRILQEDLNRAYPATQTWKLLPSNMSFEKEQIEKREKVDLGSIQTDMYRAHVLVKLSEPERMDLLQTWVLPRLQEFRLFLVCLIAGMLTICSAAGATCLRLDLKTDGKFRTWLRLATICVVLASTLATQNILAEAESHSLTGVEIQIATADNSA